MLQVSKLLSGGHGLANVLLKRAATVELDWDVRQKSRFDATDSQGRQIGVFLPRGTTVRGGDVLVAEDGTLIRVLAAPQDVLRITHCSAHGTPFDLIRAAYHLGNRHVPIELRPSHLQIEPDHVLADMLSSMHLIVTPVREPFEPEAGAYAAGGHAHAGHSHGDHSHDAHSHEGHSHGHDHAAHDHSGHSHDHAHEAHSHGHGGHDHAHDHAKPAAHAHEHGHDHAHEGHDHDCCDGHHGHDHAHPHD